MPSGENSAIDFKTLVVLATIVATVGGAGLSSGIWLSDKFSAMDEKMTRANERVRSSIFDKFTSIDLRLTKLELLVAGKDPYMKQIFPDKPGNP